MADITPFRGVLYNPANIPDIGAVVAPPYDMISGEEQAALHARDPHNFVRLDLGLILPHDGAAENRYTRAAVELREWLSKGILRQDDHPAFYVYDQAYRLQDGSALNRRGFIGLVALEDFSTGKIVPHEQTLSGPKEDRFRLMETTRAQLSQIFSFYGDPLGEIDALLASAMPAEPRFAFTDTAGVRHTLWTIDDAAILAELSRLMAGKTLFIADGHHRYETALNFRRRMVETGRPYDPGWDRVMMFCTSMDAPGMTILPFHRLIRLPEGWDAARAIDRLAACGDLTPLQGDEAGRAPTSLLKRMAELGTSRHAFGLYAEARFQLLTYPRAGEQLAYPTLVDRLDVSVLHTTLLRRMLGEEAGRESITYVRDEHEAMEQMATGGFQLAFFLNPTRVDQVRDIAAAGLRMPPKSTNFHPKLISGLLLNVLEITSQGGQKPHAS